MAGKVMCCSHLKPLLDPVTRKYTIDRCILDLKEHADRFDSIVISGYSMALIAPCVADALHKDIILVRKDNEECHSSYPVEGVLCQRYIIIDDLVGSGETIKRVKTKIGNHFYSGAKLVGIYLYQPQYSAYRTHEKVKEYLGIELLNSPHDERMAKKNWNDT